MKPFLATYRLQMNKDFTFGHARSLVPYLEKLGVSHAYLSPILKAQPGSTHGYDTVDHTVINPELGTLDDFRALVDALRGAGLGVILDFVPNHVGVGGADNPLWIDLLRHGRTSRYADWFDIDWEPPRPDLRERVLVPFLGNSLHRSLVAGDLRLKPGEDGLAVWAYDSEKLPIRPEDEAALLESHGSADGAVEALNGRPGDAGSWSGLADLCDRQHWRLSHFAAAAGEINYRRFFINSELAGIRIERQDAFDHVHRLVFGLIAEGLIDGLRIDHVDGLWDPKGYLHQLRAASPRPIYLAVEKILAPHEQLRGDWPVDGTTGYEFGAQLTRLLVDPAAEDELTRIYAAVVGAVPEPEAEAYRSKLRVMDNEMAAETAALARRLARLAWSTPQTADLTEWGLRQAAREVIAQMAVYRSYADGDPVSARDRRELGLALAKARRSLPQLQPHYFDFLGRVFSDETAARSVLQRFQQLTGPVMAKGLEDTALYRYNRLVALNEVGAHPDRFAISVEQFHAANARRRAVYPNHMLATSTHDTKRGEDTRALIAAISEHPAHWEACVKRWRAMLDSDIHPNDLYLLFQLLVGGWPLAGEDSAFAERLKGAMEKSLREARQRSDWGVNATDYERRVAELIDRVLADADFMARFRADHAVLAATGRNKALAQLVVKLTVPGAPDIYRGAEDWEQSFVDPDNRRPVDFTGLADRLSSTRPERDDKLALTAGLLGLRRRCPELFIEGSYEPLSADPRCIRFVRRHGAQRLEVLVRLDGKPLEPGEGGTEELLDLPTTEAGLPFRLKGEGLT